MHTTHVAGVTTSDFNDWCFQRLLTDRGINKVTGKRDGSEATGGHCMVAPRYTSE